MEPYIHQNGSMRPSSMGHSDMASLTSPPHDSGTMHMPLHPGYEYTGHIHTLPAAPRIDVTRIAMMELPKLSGHSPTLAQIARKARQNQFHELLQKATFMHQARQLHELVKVQYGQNIADALLLHRSTFNTVSARFRQAARWSRSSNLARVHAKLLTRKNIPKARSPPPEEEEQNAPKPMCYRKADAMAIDMLLDELMVLDRRIRQALLRGPPVSFRTYMPPPPDPNANIMKLDDREPDKGPEDDKDKTFLTSVSKIQDHVPRQDDLAGQEDQSQEQPARKKKVEIMAKSSHMQAYEQHLQHSTKSLRSLRQSSVSTQDIVFERDGHSDDEANAQDRDFDTARVPSPPPPPSPTNASRLAPPKLHNTGILQVQHGIPSFMDLCQRIRDVHRSYTCGTWKQLPVVSDTAPKQLTGVLADPTRWPELVMPRPVRPVSGRQHTYLAMGRMRSSRSSSHLRQSLHHHRSAESPDNTGWTVAAEPDATSAPTMHLDGGSALTTWEMPSYSRLPSAEVGHMPATAPAAVAAGVAAAVAAGAAAGAAAEVAAGATAGDTSAEGHVVRRSPSSSKPGDVDAGYAAAPEFVPPYTSAEYHAGDYAAGHRATEEVPSYGSYASGYQEEHAAEQYE